MRKTIALLLSAILLCSALTAYGETRQKERGETWTFTDSCGREVEIPVEINGNLQKAACSGSALVIHVVIWVLLTKGQKEAPTSKSRCQKLAKFSDIRIKIGGV